MIEGTLYKCGAHVFALDDPEHLPTPSAHPSNPRLHIAPELGIFLLCCLLSSRQAGSRGGLAAISLCVGPADCGELATMPDKRYPAGSHRVRKGAQIVGPGVVAHRGPCGRSALRLWELGGTPRPQFNSKPPRFLSAAAFL
jgi:hypothetical protein